MSMLEDRDFRDLKLRHIDVAWVAIDSKEKVGFFTTGGIGAIPMGYLQCYRGDNSFFDKLIEQSDRSIKMRCRSTVSSFARKWGIGVHDYEAWASRGFFTFDIGVDEAIKYHKPNTGLAGTNFYFPICRPTNPVHSDALPMKLRGRLFQFKQGDIDFTAQDGVCFPSDAVSFRYY